MKTIVSLIDRTKKMICCYSSLVVTHHLVQPPHHKLLLRLTKQRRYPNPLPCSYHSALLSEEEAVHRDRIWSEWWMCESYVPVARTGISPVSISAQRGTSRCLWCLFTVDPLYPFCFFVSVIFLMMLWYFNTVHTSIKCHKQLTARSSLNLSILHYRLWPECIGGVRRRTSSRTSRVSPGGLTAHLITHGKSWVDGYTLDAFTDFCSFKVGIVVLFLRRQIVPLISIESF